MHHEIAHYITRRVCGSMSTNLHDELIADFWGIRQATGRYKADWFLRFIGFDREMHFYPDGRMQHYTGTISPDSPSFTVLGKLLQAAATNLQQVDDTLRRAHPQLDPIFTLLKLTELTIDELAADCGAGKLLARIQETL